MHKLCTSSVICIIIFQSFMGLTKSLQAQVAEQDSLALVALYDSTEGANWTNNSGWLAGPVSTWYGITVSEGRVTEIQLTRNNLNGTIPPDIGNLTNLIKLQLNINQLTGTIPEEIYSLTNLLTLRLDSNELEGVISSSLGNLVNLTGLYLADNMLTGPIPAEVGNLDSLETLYLRFNQLSGEIPISLYGLTNLVTFNLSVNQLEGTISPQVGNLVNLREYSVPSNNMHGIIPEELGTIPAIRFIWLNDNDFEGAVPNTITQRPELIHLLVNNNQLSELPPLAADSTLTFFQIQNNRFTFEDIEPNVHIDVIIYSPQDSVGTALDTTIAQDSSLVLSLAVGGTANQYQWKKDGVEIPGATESSFTIAAASAADEGSYMCEITNTIASELILYSRVMHVTVSQPSAIEDRSGKVPEKFALYQNYPNPFNPSTNIEFQIPNSQFTTLKVYNMQGKQVDILVSRELHAGTYTYQFNAADLASGVYYYQLLVGDYREVKKMILLK